MSRHRKILILVSTLFGAGLMSAGIWWITRPPQGPNVLLITLDTTRADRLGCYGYRAGHTPTIDALAASGVLFENALATAPLTLPSHATMMTGLYPPEHGLRTNGKGKLGADLPTLAQILHKRGYRTGAFVGSFVLNSKFGLNQGFDEYDDDLTGTRLPHDVLHRERAGNVVVDRALKWLQSTTARPFLCWVHLYDPHSPYSPHADDFGDRFQANPYDGEVAFVDQQIARLQQFLKDRQLDTNTVVMIVGDHGEGLGDHREKTHGAMLYNTTLRVPWICVWPGRIPAAVKISKQVSLVDCGPTLLGCLGITPPQHTTGRNLRPAFDGAHVEASPCYAETDEPLLDHGWSGLRAWITPQGKYIRTARPEFYRLVDDPQEADNVAASQPQLIKTAEQELAAFEQGLRVRTAESAPLSESERRALTSLGYTGGQAAPRATSGAVLHDIKDMIVHAERVEQALELLEHGDVAKAEALLRQTLLKVPDYTDARGNLGRCLAIQGHLDAAIHEYREVLKTTPDDVSALLNLATAHLAQNRLADAEEELSQVLRLEPESADAYFHLAGLNLKQGRPGAALEIYQHALECQPDHAATHRGMGDLYSEQGALDQALQHYAAALRSDPMSVESHVNAGIVHARQNHLDQAKDFFQAALKIAPHDPLAHRNLALVDLKQGRKADAATHFEAALKVIPDDPFSLTKLAWIRATSQDEKLRNGPAAVELAQRAVALTSQSSMEALDALAAGYAASGQFDEAVRTLEQALSRSDSSSGPHSADELRQRLSLYQAKMVYVESH